MNLEEVILNCNNYADSEEMMHMVYAKKINGRFDPSSEALVLELTLEEMEMDQAAIANLKCPGYSYFLELFILQDFFADIKQLDEYKSDQEKVKRVIYYAEFDA